MTTEMIPETGWLIEHTDHSDGHKWLAMWSNTSASRLFRWTNGPLVALRFGREIDANDFHILLRLFWPEYAKDTIITQHSWS
jgi:hypothetical protein